MSISDRKLRVFLCYASQDKPVVYRLYQQLLAEGWIEPWLDIANILPGQHWTTVIKEAIYTTDSVIVLISNKSINKEGFIQREMNYAWEQSLEKPRNVIFLIPLRLEDCDIPYDLRDRQWADFFGSKKEATYQALLKSLKLRHEQKLRLETEELEQNQLSEKIHQDKEKRERRELEEIAKFEAGEKARKKTNELARQQIEEKARQEKKELDRKKAEERAKRIAELLLQKPPKENEHREQEELNQTDYSSSDVDEPHKDNTSLIVGTVVVTIFLCCCITAYIGWQYGDVITQALGG